MYQLLIGSKNDSSWSLRANPAGLVPVRDARQGKTFVAVDEPSRRSR